MQIKQRIADHSIEIEKCAECNWISGRFIKIDDKNELCPDCFVDWLINNNKQVV